jgi:hypothetical protein
MVSTKTVGRRSTRSDVENDLIVTCCDCPFTVRTGNAPLTANTRASHHALTRHHKVIVLRVTHVIDPMANQGSIFGDDEPPF